MKLSSFLLVLLLPAIASAQALLPVPAKGGRIALIGNGLGERLQDNGSFETLLHLRFPDRELTVRDLCFPGDTPAYRPRAGRPSQWAFPGGEKFHPEYRKHNGSGIEPSPDEWLTLCKADTIVAFFGYNESFDGPARAGNFEAELDAFAEHTLSQKYDGKDAPRLVLVSPIAFEDLSAGTQLQDGKQQNANLALYTAAMKKVAEKRKLAFVDLFTASKELQGKEEPLTTNGFLPTDAGERKLATLLANAIYGASPVKAKASPDTLLKLVKDKDWYWRNDYRILNGVHVYGRRREPFGTVNYPPEIDKLRRMAANRDRAIWSAANGRAFDLAAADAADPAPPPVESNFTPAIRYLTGNDALSSFKLAEGFKIELFASEERFPDLRNPVQISFDNRGRLWVAVMPSYPHYRAGDPKPNDKLLILEDTDGDGKADKQTVFADGLHLPTGIEFAPEGVYLSQQPDLLLLKDTDGDDKADTREIVLRGFDSHDTHHAISAFAADASGAFYLAEGTFLHSEVETAYGPVRGTGAGILRYDPRTRRLDRETQAAFANPWGVAFDDWDQCFIADASGGNNWWAMPLSAKVPFGYNIGMTEEFAPKRARPTSGSEFISSRHFPDELQGGYMVNNVIGFLGTSVHDIREDGSGFAGKHRMDLVTSDDPNFRPCDLEFAPDGSLYILDWHNPLIGHMQHSARDPKRDHDHGRVYRVTYPSRPLVKPVAIAGAPVKDLLKALEEPEYRTRYRARRELRSHGAAEVLPAVKTWLASLDPAAPRYEHHLCEALWATWASGAIDASILERCLAAKAPQARTAAVDVLRFSWREVPNHASLLKKAAADPHPRVRFASIIAASWMDNADGARIAAEALKHPLDSWMPEAVKGALVTLRDDLEGLSKAGGLADAPEARDYLAGTWKPAEAPKPVAASEEPKLDPADLELYRLGKEVYSRDIHCSTCHQPQGQGDQIYPPLAKSEWVGGDEGKLIKLVLKGVWGPITVNGKVYDPKNGVPPMTPFEHLLNDREVAGVLTYIRNSFGNAAAPVKPEAVKKIREEIKDKKDFYTVEDLLK